MFVLDASAVLRYIDKEAGAARVDEILLLHVSGRAYAMISAMHWGEIIGVFYKRHGIDKANAQIAELRALSLIVVPVTGEHAERSSRIRAQYKIPYVDSLAVELTTTTPEHILITADFDMKPAESFINIEFLPTKSLH